jgi:hypothetical protein
VRDDRGYGADHKKLRAKIQAAMDAGTVFQCWRCGKVISGDFDLGHDDDDRTKYMGPEHRACNRATAAHKAAIVVDDSREW